MITNLVNKFRRWWSSNQKCCEVKYLELHKSISTAASLGRLATIKRQIAQLESSIINKTDTDEYMISLLKKKWEMKYNQWKRHHS